MTDLFENDGIEIDCMFCLAEGAGRVRIDKKSHPYVICHACGTRSFLKTTKSLAILGFLKSGLAQALKADEARVQQADASTQELRERLGAFA